LHELLVLLKYGSKLAGKRFKVDLLLYSGLKKKKNQEFKNQY